MTETPEGMTPDEVAALVSAYKEKRETYRSFARRCQELIERLLQGEGIRVHSVEFREKDPEKLGEKLSRTGKQYHALDDVTDLAGIRIITHMADEVNSVAAVIEEEFDVLPEHSIDKSQLLDPDRFGYRSLHYVCRLPNRRVALREYQDFAGLTCEIQLRSILQHAWAEIEHDLGYKSPEAIPTAIRRRFSRLAALLETADDEFIRIRDELAAYASGVEERLHADPNEVALDKISLTSFLEHDAYLRALERDLVTSVGAIVSDRPDDPFVEFLAVALKAVGLHTLGEVSQALRDSEAILTRLIKSSAPKGRHAKLTRSVFLHRLWQVLAARLGGAERLEEIWELYGWRIEEKGWGESLVKAIRRVEAELDAEMGNGE